MTRARPISLVLAAGLAVVLYACASPESATPSASAGAAPAAQGAAAASQPAAAAGTSTPGAVAFAGADSPMYKGGPGRTGEMPGPAITSQPATLWTVALGGPAISSPAVVDDVAYVSAGNHHVLAVAADTGNVVWEAATKYPVRSSPAVAGGLVFVNDEGGGLTAYDTGTGTVRWTADAGAASESMPLVLDGILYIGTQAGDLLALDAATGTRRWAFPTGGELTHSPSSDGTRVFIGSADGTLYGVDLATGKLAWKFKGDAARWTTAAVRDGTLFTVGHEVGGGKDALFAFDTATGLVRWQAPSDSPLWAPSAGAGTAYIADANGILRAIDAATGQERWSAAVGGYMRPAPAVVGSALYVFGGSNEALGIDGATGRILWRTPIDGTVEYGTTAAGGRVFAVTTAGTLYAIGPKALAVATSAPPSATASLQASVTATLKTALAGAPGGLSVPTGLDVDPKGRTWVAEGGKNDFAIYGADGAFLERWGSSGSGPGQFDFNNANSGNPTADIVFAPDGAFYVADTGNFRVQQFDAQRTFVRAWGGFGKGNGQFAIPVRARPRRAPERVCHLGQRERPGLHAGRRVRPHDRRARLGRRPACERGPRRLRRQAPGRRLR